MVIQPQYITDTQGNTVSAILPIEKYNEMLEIIEFYEENEMLEDIKAYKEVKRNNPEYEPFDEVVKRILSNDEK